MGQLLDISGLPYGRLIAIDRCTDSAGQQGTVWNCKCFCGRWAKVRLKDLTNGNTTSCGCLRGEVGKTYGIAGRLLASARKITVGDVTDTVKGWSARTGLSVHTIHQRVRQDWPVDLLLSAAAPGVALSKRAAASPPTPT